MTDVTFLLKINMRILFKVLAVLVTMWLVSIVTIVTHYKYGSFLYKATTRETFTPYKTYDEALENFKKTYLNPQESQTESPFRVWTSLDIKPNYSLQYDPLKFIIPQALHPGVNGTPVIIDDDNLRHYVKEHVNRGYRNHAFNQYVSDMIPLNRSIPDPRDEWCKQQKYKDLPRASIIICFHNEAWSTLLRTLHSVLNRTPTNLISNIVLYDDGSTMDHLKENLAAYTKCMHKVKLVRQLRQGLIRSRIIASQHATGEVLVYLDSHCECTEGWLEPLLQRIQEDPRTVASPVVDVIRDTTFEYIAQDIHDLKIGGFNWNLKFAWTAVPREVLLKRKVPAAAIETPTISGGLFAVNKKFFKELGYYDPQFNVWGGDNLELSFKTWMCGGTLEIVPCSHVGHVFRKRFPYEIKGSVTRNLVRLAEVWMDEYAKYFYQTIGNQKVNVGNLSQRKLLRKNLKCYSFKWYLNNVYPQLPLPEDNVASGTIYSMRDVGKCFDAKTNSLELQQTVSLKPCHFKGGNQYWVYTRRGEIKRDELCLDYILGIITLYMCHGRALSQVWLYEEGFNQIRHMATQKCLQITNTREGSGLTLKPCVDIDKQKWIMENYTVKKLVPELRNQAMQQYQKAMTRQLMKTQF